MSDKLYFAGSIYKRIKRGRGLKECIAKANGYEGWFMTNYNGQSALITEGRLYVFIGKEKGFKSPWNK